MNRVDVLIKRTAIRNSDLREIFDRLADAGYVYHEGFVFSLERTAHLPYLCFEAFGYGREDENFNACYASYPEASDDVVESIDDLIESVRNYRDLNQLEGAQHD